jgi:hypothetical protein
LSAWSAGEKQGWNTLCSHQSIEVFEIMDKIIWKVRPGTLLYLYPLGTGDRTGATSEAAGWGVKVSVRKKEL